MNETVQATPEYLKRSPFGWFMKNMAGGIHARGRAGRREYWWFQLFSWAIPAGISTVVMVVTNIVLFAMLIYTPDNIAGALIVPVWLNLLTVSAGACFLLPDLALTVRRLHDRGHSGWWCLLILVPFVNILLLVWMCQDGLGEENRFGVNPKLEFPAEIRENGDAAPALPNAFSRPALSVVLAFFGPLYGLVLWFALRKNHKPLGNVVLAVAIVGAVFSLILTFYFMHLWEREITYFVYNEIYY